MDESPAPSTRFSFTLRSLLLLTGYVACAMAWMHWFHIPWWEWKSWYPGWIGLLSIVVLLSIALSNKRTYHGAKVDWLLLAWLITAINVADGLLSRFVICDLSAPTPANYARLYIECIPEVWCCAVTVPLFVALPVSYRAFARGHFRVSPATPWLVIVSLVAMFDLTLCGVAIYLPNEIAGIVGER